MSTREITCLQKPVAWGVFEGGNLHDMFFSKEEADHMAQIKGVQAEVRPLTTPPAQPAAVPLTDEQIHALDPAPDCMFDQQRIDFARAIEAAHNITEKVKP